MSIIKVFFYRAAKPRYIESRSDCMEGKMKMLKGNIILIVVLAVFSVVTLWGCAGNLPESKRVDYLEQNWGKSFESAKKNQILNPEAGKTV